MKLLTISAAAANLYEVSDSLRRARSLDGTRGLAVLLVFFVHYHALFSIYVIEEPISFAVSRFLETIGHCGVDLFFTLSGYLIYGIVIQKPLCYSSFLWRRIKRIYPTFLCVLGLYLVLSFLFSTRSRLPDSWGKGSLYILQNVALLPGIFPIPPLITVSWTLSYEFAFYLSIPLIVGMAGMRSWRGWQRMVLFVALSSSYIGLSLVALPGLHLRLTMFVVGILLWETLNYDRVKEKLTRMGEIGAIVLYLGSLVLIYWVSMYPASLPRVTGVRNLPGVSRVCLTAVGNFAFGLYCFGFDGTLNKFFSLAPFRWLGNMSYSYYLIHGLTLNGFALVLTHWFRPSGASPVVFWFTIPCAFLMTLSTATLLFAFVEKPFSLRQRRVVLLPSSGELHSAEAMTSSRDRVRLEQTVN